MDMENEININYEILTDLGFKDFYGIQQETVKFTIEITTDDHSKIRCTPDHILFLEDLSGKKASSIGIGEVLFGGNPVVDIIYSNKDIEVYDILQVRDVNRFFANNILVKNCCVLDEFAHVPTSLASEFFASTYPVLSSGKDSKLIVISCVTKDTYILSDKGIKQVSDFIEVNREPHPKLGYEIPEYNIMGMSKINHGNIMVNSGVAKTKIITSKFSTLECSLEHKLWCYKDGKFDWIKAKDLTEDDYISIRYGDRIWGDNDDISGYTPGEILPKSILKCSEDNIISVLIDIFKFAAVSENGTISLRLEKVELIVQLRMILLNLGILSEIKNKNKLEITSYSDCLKFYNIIGFIDPENQNKRLSLIENREESIFDIRGNKNLKWEKIKSITDSENEVFDFSLDHIDGDKWCHSVLYNGIVGHQTPRGMNMFYNMWTEAVAGKNGYAWVDVPWTKIPGRGEKFKEDTIKVVGQRKWNQEFESISADCIVNTNDHGDIKIGELYDSLNIEESNV